MHAFLASNFYQKGLWSRVLDKFWHEAYTIFWDIQSSPVCMNLNPSPHQYSQWQLQCQSQPWIRTQVIKTNACTAFVSDKLQQKHPAQHKWNLASAQRPVSSRSLSCPCSLRPLWVFRVHTMHLQYFWAKQTTSYERSENNYPQGCSCCCPATAAAYISLNDKAFRVCALARTTVLWRWSKHISPRTRAEDNHSLIVKPKMKHVVKVWRKKNLCGWPPSYFQDILAFALFQIVVTFKGMFTLGGLMLQGIDTLGMRTCDISCLTSTWSAIIYW